MKELGKRNPGINGGVARKAAPIRYLFAHHWPVKGFCGIFALIVLCVALQQCSPSLSLLRDWQYDLLLVAVVLITPVLGFFLSLPFVVIFITPLYEFQAWRNGAPFEMGARVRILTGPYEGQRTYVRGTWQGGCVRVALGEEAAANYCDVFTPTQLWREPEDC